MSIGCSGCQDDPGSSDGAASNPTDAATALEMANDYIDVYASVYDRLVVHDPRYPTPADLAALTVEAHDYAASAEVRGWSGGGERAVRLTADLIDNATDAVQKDERLVAAARTLARHAEALVPYHPKFWRGAEELRAVDDVFVRTMRAAGQPKVRPSSSGNLGGETVTYSPILRVGRVSEGGRVQARIRLEGRPLEVDIVPNLVEHIWDAAKTGDVLPLRVRGEWIESKTGELRLVEAEIIGVDATFDPWSGRKLLDDARQHAALFTAEDFDRMLSEH